MADLPTTWTDPSTGIEYDLSGALVDGDGDTWTHSGWLCRLNGTRIPVVSCAEDDSAIYTDVPLPHVIGSYGPLTAAPQDDRDV